MTPDERRIRLRIAREIIGNVLVDFLEESPDCRYTSIGVQRDIGVLDDDTFGYFLNHLWSEGRIDNHKTGQYNRWQARQEEA